MDILGRSLQPCQVCFDSLKEARSRDLLFSKFYLKSRHEWMNSLLKNYSTLISI